MKRCPVCDKTLGVDAYLTMNTGNHPTCRHCGARYRWDANGWMMLLVIAVAAGAALVLSQGLVSGLPGWSLLVVVPLLIVACAAIAIAAMRPVPVNPPSRSGEGSI